MTKEARIKALSESEFSPIRTAAALNAMSDVELDGLEKHVAKKVEEKAAAAKKKQDDDAAAAKLAANASTQLTEEAFLATAPDSIRLIVASAKKADADKRAALIKTLAKAQKVYNETQLTAMSTELLESTHELLKSSIKDYSGLGLPVSVFEEKKDDVYSNPPDGYALAIASAKK